jgi:hypothetical protein
VDPAARPAHLKPVTPAPVRHLHPSPHKAQPLSVTYERLFEG